MAFELQVNGHTVTVDVDADTPLLWVLRDNLQLNGTKYGCGIGACGACSVHVDGNLVRSCSYPVAAAAGRSITTIEALSPDRSHAVQQAWIAEEVPQCGYCQSGMIMAAVTLLERNPTPGDKDIAEAMTNICRCGTYSRVKRAIHRASAQLAGSAGGRTNG